MQRIRHLCLLAEYNQWMNAKLYAAAGTLPEEALLLNRQAFFGSLLGTLNHLAVADTIWLQRFAQHPSRFAALAPVQAWPAPQQLKQQLFSDLPSLSAYRQQLDQLICAWTPTLTPADLDQPLPYCNMQGVPASKDFFALLTHFFNHQTHHRGQATTLLSQAGVDVGVTDLLALIPNQLES